MPHPASLILHLILALVLTGCAATPQPETEVTADVLEPALRQHDVDVWYPRTIDRTHGGYLSDFDATWTPTAPQNKMMVTQARHIWSLSQLAAFYPAEADTFLAMASHGVDFLRDVMWDDEHGGFYHLVTRDGTPITSGSNAYKLAYDHAFAIYALAAYATAADDDEALALAQETFRWLEAHSHDPEHGGYFQFMQPDGTPITEGVGRTPPKDQNSGIHLLEAFTELYPVWPDPLVRERLAEMHELIRDVVPDERGFLQLFFEPDWTPVSYRDSSAAAREANYYIDHVSFGHDVETAFLLLDAAEALGIPNDPATRALAMNLVEHALANGWDDENGGFFDRGYYFAGADTLTIIQDSKAWWAQAEALHTFLLMAQTFPDDAERYLDLFDTQWQHIDTYLLDHEYGGWYLHALDTSPQARTAPKGSIWKGNYHTARTLINTIRMLRGE